MEILAVCWHPGLANVVLPVVEYLRKQRIGVSLIAHEWATEECLKRGIKFDTADKLDLLLERADLVFTGTSVPDGIEKEARHKAKKKEVKTVAIIDMYGSYKARFTFRGCLESPDWIIVIDEIMGEEVVETGIPESRIKVFGSPYFERLKQCPGDASVKAFVAQPLRDMEFHYQIDMDKLIQSVKDWIVCPHPREDPQVIARWQKKYNLSRAGKVWEKAGLIASFNSTMLIEGGIQGKKVVAIQPKEIVQSKIFGSLIPIVRDINFIGSLSSGLFEKYREKHVGACKRIAEFLVSLQ